VNTELEEDFDNEQLKVRVRIGKRSPVFAVYNGTWGASRGIEW
jgi:hypothetical protein